MSEHLSNETILGLASNDRSGAEAGDAWQHLGGCEECRRRLEVAVGAPPPPRMSPTVATPTAGPLPSTPQQIGRYRVMRELGRGAMGVVLLADDSLLGRQVALKAVGAVLDGQLSAHVTSEARAIARARTPV